MYMESRLGETGPTCEDMGVGFEAVLGGIKGFRSHDSALSSLASE